MSDRRFTNLTDRQADGLACVECRAELDTVGTRSRPVGRSAVTGAEVFACVPRCAEQPAAVTS